MSLNSCLKKLKFSSEDAKEIRRIARETGGSVEGVQAYLDQLAADKQDLRDQLSDQGFNVAVQETQAPAQDLFQGEQAAKDAMRETIPEQGLPLFQGEAGPLGAFSSADPNNIQIKLFENADLSTLLHESGHMFVFMLEHMAALPGASKRVQENYRAMLDWVGAESADDLNVAINGDAARAKQEKLAEAFEAYLKEGKAPSAKLQSAFAQFAEWLKMVYRGIRRLGTEIDPEISQIFDRMLATDAQIEEMKTINEFDPSASPSIIELMTPNQRARWLATSEAADEVGRNEAARVQAEAEQIAKQEAWKIEHAKVRAQIEKDLWDRPQYRAFWYLTRGVFKNGETSAGMVNRRLDKQGLLDMGVTQEQLNDLPRKGGKRIYTSDPDTATDPGLLAPFLGFNDAEELVSVLTGMLSVDETLDTEADIEMRSRHGDPLNDGTIEELTEQALYNSERRRAIQIELDAIANQTGHAKVGREMINAIADRILADRPLTELLQPNRYMSAAIRAAKASERAQATGDSIKAFEEKRKQLLNHELLRRALKAKTEVEKAQKYFTKFTNDRKKYKTLEADYVDRIKELLDAYQLGPRLSAGKRDALNTAAFRDWMDKAAKDDGAILQIPPEVLAADEKTHWRDTTLPEFRALRDTVKNIEAQARLVKQGINALEDMRRDEILDEIEVAMSRLPDTAVSTRMAETNPAWYDPALSWVKSADAAMIKIEFMLEHIDGKVNGPSQNAIFQPFSDAESEENTFVVAFSAAFADAYNAIPADVQKVMNKKVWNPALGRYVKRSEILHMALNTGNASNFQKMINGSDKDIYGTPSLSEEMVFDALQDLTAEEIHFVNTVWSLFETMYPAVEAVHRRENGVSPKKLPSVETELPNGTLTGGYIPMMYDPSRSNRAADIENKSALDMMQSETVRASVFSGMTETRVEGFSAPVVLDISRLPGELQKTAHFITHYEPVRNANKIIADSRFHTIVVNKMGQEYYDILKSWVGQVATGSRGKLRFDMIGDSIEFLRGNATVAIMGASVTTTLTQPLGLFTSTDALARGIDGKYRATRGITAMLGGLASVFNPGANKQAFEKSKELQFRITNADRDIKMAMKGLAGAKGKKAQIQRMLLISIPAVQLYTVDLPSWTAAYNMALKGNMNEGDAVNFADSLIRKSQGAGSAKDLSAVLATRGASRAMTMFMTFFNTLYNIQSRVARESEFTANYMNKLVTGSLILYVMPSVIEAMFRLEGPDPDDDEYWTEYLKFLAAKVALFAGSTIPGLRDLASAAGSKFGYSGSPVTGLFENAAKMTNSAADLFDEDKEIKPAVVKTAINLIGYGTGVVPSNQINRAVRWYEKWAIEDEDTIIWEFFVGPDKREKR